MEIENTSQVHRQRKMAFQDTTGKKNSGTSGSVNAGASIPRGNRTSGFSQRSQPVSPSKIPEAGKPCESAARHQSNSITNYFQVSRKRYVEMFVTLLPLLACSWSFWKILTQAMYFKFDMYLKR